jgi:autotransporter translocation and assembly factor TamB
VAAGSVNYLGREFVITKGIIDFLNPYRTEPTVDVAAEMRAGGAKIQLTLSGPPDALATELSAPGLDDQDKLSLLVTGRRINELRDYARRDSTAIFGAPRQMLGDLITLAARSKEDAVRQLTGLDVFSVETGIAGESSRTGADSIPADRVRVTVGKQLSRRLSTSLSVESSGGPVARRTAAEYRLLENTVVSGFEDSRGTYGGALRIELEARDLPGILPRNGK